MVLLLAPVTTSLYWYEPVLPNIGSAIVIVGADVYPNPAFVTLTSVTIPTELITARPVATTVVPEPVGELNVTRGSESYPLPPDVTETTPTTPSPIDVVAATPAPPPPTKAIPGATVYPIPVLRNSTPWTFVPSTKPLQSMSPSIIVATPTAVVPPDGAAEKATVGIDVKLFPLFVSWTNLMPPLTIPVIAVAVAAVPTIERVILYPWSTMLSSISAISVVITSSSYLKSSHVNW